MTESRTNPPRPRTDEEFVAQARARLPVPLSGRDRWTSLTLGGGFVAAALTMAALLPGHRPVALLPALLLVGCYGVVSRIEFELGPGSAVPTQLVLVPMLFLLPVSTVPLFVGAGCLLGLTVDHFKRKRHPQRAFVLLSYSWHAVGPALVLSLFGDGHVRTRDWPIYLAALAAQFAFDLASSTAREKLAFGVSPRRLFPYLAWVYAVDLLLAPVALLAAASSEESAFGFILALPLVGLLALLTCDRSRRIDRAVELSEAYHGATREARSDPLTGLGNRLAWDEALEAAEAGAVPGPVSVILIDLNNLKLANDSRGHEFGDKLLRSVATLLRRSVREVDLVARVGGDELGILMTQTGADRCRAVVARIEAAVAQHPTLDGFPLSAAIGHDTRPHASLVAQAVRNADREMYVHKRTRSLRLGDFGNVVTLLRAERQPAPGPDEICAVLLSAMRERDEDLENHALEVAALSVAVARQLDISLPEIEDLARAAKLHDLGKLAVPEAILQKPGLLTEPEWVAIRRHPLSGDRILASAPDLHETAKILRASYERYDGCGYPDRLIGEAIPLGARIVSVCDAFVTITSERP